MSSYTELQFEETSKILMTSFSSMPSHWTQQMKISAHNQAEMVRSTGCKARWSSPMFHNLEVETNLVDNVRR